MGNHSDSAPQAGRGAGSDSLKADAKAVPILDVARALQGEAGGRFTLRERGNQWAARCLNDDREDREPSLRLWAQKNRWKCFACGDDGDGIDLVQKVLGLCFRDALAWIKDKFNLRGAMLAPSESPLELWSRRRGLPVASVQAFDPEVREEYGHQVLLFPRRERPCGAPVAFQKRRADNGPITGRKRSISEGPMKGVYFPAEWPEPHEDSVLLIVEGETDAVAAHAAGFKWIAGTPGKSWSPDVMESLERVGRAFRTQALVMDGDVPDHGEQGLFARAEFLDASPVRVPAHIAGTPAARDLSEWLVKEGAGAVRLGIDTVLRGTAPFTALRRGALPSIRKAVQDHGGGLQPRHFALLDFIALHLVTHVLPFQGRDVSVSRHRVLRVGPQQWLTTYGELAELAGCRSLQPVRTCLKKMQQAGLVRCEKRGRKLLVTVYAISQYAKVTRTMYQGFLNQKGIGTTQRPLTQRAAARG